MLNEEAGTFLAQKNNGKSRKRKRRETQRERKRESKIYKPSPQPGPIDVTTLKWSYLGPQMRRILPPCKLTKISSGLRVAMDSGPTILPSRTLSTSSIMLFLASAPSRGNGGSKLKV